MTDKEYLDKALDLIVELTDANCDICERLCKMPEEDAICSEHCNNFDKNCVLRYLKYYE